MSRMGDAYIDAMNTVKYLKLGIEVRDGESFVVGLDDGFFDVPHDDEAAFLRMDLRPYYILKIADKPTSTLYMLTCDPARVVRPSEIPAKLRPKRRP